MREVATLNSNDGMTVCGYIRFNFDKKCWIDEIIANIFQFHGNGGGFGEFGQDGKYSNGGCDYGDDLLTSMYMGSGGGASEKCNGGNGGGCVWIYCLNDIELSENALINASGQDGFDANLLEKGGGGGGSGGSIYIECKKLKLASTSKILAVGGKGGKAIKPFGHDGGSGGDGRICIKVKGANSIGYTQNIRP